MTNINTFTAQFPAVNEGEMSVCYIVNTCEYCVEVLPQLEGTVKSRVDPKFEGDVDLSSEQDAFHDVISTAIRVRNSVYYHYFRTTAVC